MLAIMTSEEELADLVKKGYVELVTHAGARYCSLTKRGLELAERMRLGEALPQADADMLNRVVLKIKPIPSSSSSEG